MRANFIDDLIEATHRVFRPDSEALKEVLIISGMPDKTQNLRYLSFNRQVAREAAAVKAFSAVALINNARADQWKLEGYFRKISQIVFSPRWTRNELDLFLNALRCSPEIITLMATAGAAYSLLGILQIEDPGHSGIFRRWSQRIRPALIIPGLDREGYKIVEAFEQANEIRKSTRIGK
jgi:hypothetical protein